jgi:hypothetical protein
MRLNLNRMYEELQELKNWRSGFFVSSWPNRWPTKKAQRILNKSKKKTSRICAKYNKILYSCRECRGSGLKFSQSTEKDIHGATQGFVRFTKCPSCDSSGALTWIDKMIGRGGKISV